MSCLKQMRRLVSTNISTKCTLTVVTVYMCIYTVIAVPYMKEHKSKQGMPRQSGKDATASLNGIVTSSSCVNANGCYQTTWMPALFSLQRQVKTKLLKQAKGHSFASVHNGYHTRKTFYSYSNFTTCLKDISLMY